MEAIAGTANKTMGVANELFDNAKENFLALLKDKSKWGVLYLIFLIIILVWLLVVYIRGKLTLRSNNNYYMINAYDDRGETKIGGISSANAAHKHLLRDYYVASSYNSCCGGNAAKDFVDMVPLIQVIKQGARWLDFEIYSVKGEPVIAAGPGPTDGKYCLKGTYNSLRLGGVLEKVRMLAFSGQNAPNPDDPLFLSFRVKTNNKNIYPIMADKLNRIFAGKFLGPKYSYDGKYNKSGKDIIANIPLLNLRKKVIIYVDDPTNNYRGTPFEQFVNMSGKSHAGQGMPFVTTYRNIDIVQSYDTKSLINTNKKFLGITFPDFTKIVTNPPAAIHHNFGCQFVTMNYQDLDANMIYYLNFFSDKGSAFRLKPDHLRYWERKVKAPPPQNPKLSYATRYMNTLGGAYKPGI